MIRPIRAASEASIGFTATAVGLLLALSVFPADPSPEGALVVPAALLASGILFVPMLRAIRRSSSLLNAENLVASGYVFWLLLDPLQGAYDLRDAADWAVRDAFIAIGVSASTMWLGVLGRPWPLPKWLAEIAMRPMDTKTVGRLVPVCLFLGLFNYLYTTGFDLELMFSYLGADRWSVPWARAQLGGWGSFRDQMQYFGYVLPSLTALIIARRGFAVQAWVSIAASALMLTFLAQGGGRRIIGVTVGAALLVWIQAQPVLNVRKLAIAGAVVVVMATAMQMMLNLRNIGYAEYAYRGESQYDYLHIDDNFLRLAQVIQIVPAEHPHVGFKQLLFTMVRPVPRVFWPNKPVDPGFDLPAIVGMKDVSLSTSIIGEWYLSFGWVAILFGGWLHGRLARTVNVLRERPEFRTNPIVYGLTVMILVSGMRSMQDLVIMSYALVAWWMANRLTRVRAIATR